MTATILVVDDEPELRALVRAALEPVGYRILEAGSAEEALRVVAGEETVDIVLIDWILPGRTGLDLQRDLFEREPSLRTILVTGFGTIETAIRCMKDGARDFLRKPFTPEALRRAVGGALSREGREAPVAAVRREFVRTNVNGFSFELERTDVDGNLGDVRCTFVVQGHGLISNEVAVVLPAYVQELAKALLDVETLPCGRRFWTKMCEEELAGYLWRHDAILPDLTLRIEDVTAGQREWLESVTTVVREPAHA